MLRGPGNALRGSLEHLSSDDRELRVANLHDLMQVVGVLVIDVTAREDENTHEDRMTVAKARTKGMNLPADTRPTVRSGRCRLRSTKAGA